MGALTCKHSSRQVQLQKARGKGSQDHARGSQEPASQHHWATAKARHEDAGQGACGQSRVIV